MRARITQRDDKLAHQIQLVQKGQLTMVTCNCRRVGEEFVDIAMINPWEDPWPHYNNPTNHNQMRGEFTKESTAEVRNV